MESKNDNKQESISPLNFSNTQDDLNPENKEIIRKIVNRKLSCIFPLNNYFVKFDQN